MSNEIKDSIAVLVKALKEDDGYYMGWQANIAMAFFDECGKTILNDKRHILDIANQAAKNFLDMLINTEIK